MARASSSLCGYSRIETEPGAKGAGGVAASIPVNLRAIGRGVTVTTGGGHLDPHMPAGRSPWPNSSAGSRPGQPSVDRRRTPSRWSSVTIRRALATLASSIVRSAPRGSPKPSTTSWPTSVSVDRMECS